MRALIAIVAIALAVTLLSSVYVVNETEQVIITQFGEPVGDTVDQPGLHFKAPFIQKVNRFDKRFLEWDGEANELTTRDKRFIFVDTMARWRITDPLLFFQRLRDERGAQSRLDDILDGETRNAVANHALVEIVRTSNREPEVDTSLPDQEDAFEEIDFGRDQLREQILEASRSRTGDLGIEILDVRLKRINYTEEVRRKVYDRMIAERQRIATQYRSEGDGEAARIRGERDRELKRIQSEAYREAQEIRGKADAEATTIYAEAYDQSTQSREFYGFLKTLETYEATVDPETVLVLSTDSDLYGVLKDGE
ncbi:MAG: protease modulator HflC [Acidobacteriota bacterium]|jgi:membrane protease subunit HflC